MRNIIILLGCSCALLCMEMYSLWPYPSPKINPFPFSPQVVSQQTHMDYTFTRLGYCILFLVIWYMSGRQWQFLVLFLLMCGYLIDYRLIYNNPFAMGYAFGKEIPLSYTLFMIITAGIVVVKSVIEVWGKK